MKKVGILTFQRAVNYGAALQMYALQNKIKKLGYDVEVIDYDNEMISDGYKVLCCHDLVHPHTLLNKLVNYQNIKSRNQKFMDFTRQNIKFSPVIKRTELDTIQDDYSCYIVGSDQVWNPDITDNDTSYFLDFVKQNRKKFSYAASFGVSKWPTSSTIPLKKLLSQFKHISVREKTGAEIVRTVLPDNNNISVELDPVFLLERTDWKKFVKQSSITGKRYLFVYTVGNPQNVYTFAQKLADKQNLEIINLRYAKSLRNKKSEIGHVIYDASPDEFVSYIANASCIVTNSFHATAFSIIFNKSMYVEMPQGLSSRIQDLFHLLGIANRTMGEPVDKLEWNKINQNLMQAREQSLQYLKDMLSGDEQ